MQRGVSGAVRQEPPRIQRARRRDSARPGLADAARRALLGETVRMPPAWYARGDRDAGGQRIAVTCTLFPLRDGEGDVAHVAVAYKDVTAETEAARLRALADEMPAHVLENMTEAVTLADDGGSCCTRIPTADRMFGYARGELLGKHVTVLNAYPARGERAHHRGGDRASPRQRRVDRPVGQPAGRTARRSRPGRASPS